MAEQTSNDNDDPREQGGIRVPDAHGQAAMLLVESLLHSMVARSLLSLKDAVEIVGVAAEVKNEIGEELGDAPATMKRSLALLDSIRRSLSNDLET